MSSCRNVDNLKKHINRLSRIEGQIQAIKKKIANDRPCEEILRLTASAKGAIGSFGSAILTEHLQGCVSEAMSDQKNRQSTIQGAMALFNKFTN
jgi:CsoR family transcriptional regulator, copper-sensing transcriptional repressor